MNAQNYPVTTQFGYVPGYPLNNGFHNGVDYGCPSGTPVVVNGVTIGLSGNSGYSTGSHLHVGRWVNGAATNPGSGGTRFDSAVVTQINNDSTNGNYVRVQGDGASWVYLHLSNNNLVTVGTVLNKAQGGDEMVIPDQDNWYGRFSKLMYQIRDRNISREEFQKNFVGVEAFHMVEILSDDPEADNATHIQEVGRVAVRDKWDKQIYDLLDTVKKLQAGGSVSDDKIAALAKQADDLELAIKNVKK